MLTSQRKRLILDLLARDGQVVAKQLSHQLELSEDTIRRDLRELAAEGLLLRVHGGAMPVSPTVVPIAERRTISTDAKSALGKAGADLIHDGMTVVFDGGTSNLEIIRHLPVAARFTAITHSPTIAVALEDRPNVDAVIIGGKLFRHSMVAVGALAAEAISRIRADLFFLGVTGVHPTEGLTTGDMEEAAIKRQLMACSAETAVLATNDKLGAVSPFQIGGLGDIATLIVESNAADERIVALAGSGVSILRAG
ncbi:DeoR/GlpR family DNA-binding transcription regulator [Aminobacter aminovorans]|uniref:DeoR/GlpR family DNA-binding transcription regulator n=1 Tax=Aminobacter aminovorans TaxID=83263 RepID=UPI002860C0DC|nr:DeoR/GlpR family DNA-binding transcription regulator [Aminobacter aminovorans]MDR7223281.1 DeoR/GlpR family transcriptional regulator of sugar metabolism [Aminobacter aminovorans]